jgi:hypothetical protein
MIGKLKAGHAREWGGVVGWGGGDDGREGQRGGMKGEVDTLVYTCTKVRCERKQSCNEAHVYTV